MVASPHRRKTPVHKNPAGDIEIGNIKNSSQGSSSQGKIKYLRWRKIGSWLEKLLMAEERVLN